MNGIGVELSRRPSGVCPIQFLNICHFYTAATVALVVALCVTFYDFEPDIRIKVLRQRPEYRQTSRRRHSEVDYSRSHGRVFSVGDAQMYTKGGSPSIK